MNENTDQNQSLKPIENNQEKPLENNHVNSLDNNHLNNLNKKPKKKHIKKLFIVLIILVIILLIGVIVYSFNKASNTKTVSNAKHDIQKLSYAVSGEGDIPQYPINFSATSFSVEVNAQLFEGLVKFENQTNIKPLIADSWNNVNDTTWVFNLKHNVKFHSGRTLTANDVKYTLDYAIAHQDDNDGQSVLALAGTLNSITVNNPYKVTITTSSPDPVLLSKLTYLGIIDSKAKLGDYNASTGPYIVKPGTVPNSSNIKLVAANNYWGGHVYTKELDISEYNDTQKLYNDAKSRKLDLSGDFTTSQIKNINPKNVIYIPDDGPDFIALNVNNKKSIISNPQVRQAIAYALNKNEVLNQSDLNGQPVNQLLPIFVTGHNPKIATINYDPTKAQSLLSTVPNKTQQLTFEYISGNDDQAVAIANQLKQVGLNIKLIKTDDLDTVVNDAINGTYDMVSYGYQTSYQDGSDILAGVLQDNEEYTNPQIDELLSKASQTLNESDRISDMQQVETIVAKDNPVIPLYDINRQFALNKSYVIKQDMPGQIMGVYFWKVYSPQ